MLSTCYFIARPPAFKKLYLKFKNISFSTELHVGIDYEFISYTLNFYNQHFFSTPCCLNFSGIELRTLLRCCLTHIRITMPRHFLYLLYLADLCLAYVICFLFLPLFLHAYFFFSVLQNWFH